MNDIEKKLKAPFRADEYEWRVQSETHDGTKVMVLCYVQARAIQNRLDDVLGVFGWQSRYQMFDSGAVLCALSLLHPSTGQWICKEDGASQTDIEAVKGGISGALKRAGSAWGIGRLLYNLPANRVALKTSGEHWHKVKKGPNQGKFMYWDAPRLPAWAVSDGAGATPVALEPEDPPEPKPAPPKPDIDHAGLTSDKGIAYLKANFKTGAEAVAKLKLTKNVPLASEAFIMELFEEDAA